MHFQSPQLFGVETKILSKTLIYFFFKGSFNQVSPRKWVENVRLTNSVICSKKIVLLFFHFPRTEYHPSREFSCNVYLGESLYLKYGVETADCCS